ncbi:MAG: hypothetical protein R3F11_18260 [Verrucomicrobiales bacterium]
MLRSCTNMRCGRSPSLPGGNLLVSASTDGTVRLWSTASAASDETPGRGRIAHDLQFRGPPFAFSPDGSQFAAGRNEAFEIYALPFDPRAEPITLRMDGAKAIAAEFANAGEVALVAAPADGAPLECRRYDSHSGKAAGSPVALPGSGGGGVTTSDLSDGGGRFAASFDGAPGHTLAWETSTGEPLPAPPTGSVGVHAVLRFSPDGNMLAAQHYPSNEQMVWDIAEGEIAPSSKLLPDEPAHAFAFTPDAKSLLLALGGGTIAVCDLERTGRPAGELIGHLEHPFRVAVSPDGKTAASCSRDGTLRLWNLPTRREVAVLSRHRHFSQLAFSPDGSAFAAGGYGGVLLWRLPSLAEIDARPQMFR